ncbi:hypothetical protein QAD02_011882 [Eretmocerus hayati]|uniref:Uncharacterized protein n=1 Tax=Eretmocerus hayati TaxID=131215 RepID=A0ACC2NZ70_9HYME|nr:hypothetical protein QAD02_011882 [Eretmocerus hayati]
MIYGHHQGHQAPTMSSANKSSPRARPKQTPGPPSRKTSVTKQQQQQQQQQKTNEEAAAAKVANRCRGRCRVQWSEQHVKEGLVLVQEAQLARVVKTRPITEHYDMEPKPFASGQWARVYKCRSRSTGTVYAAKFSSRNRFNADCSAELRHEIALLSLCSQSPRVVRLHDVYETPKEIIMVMEYAPGGDLQTLIDGDLVPLEGDVVHFVRQLVEGLAYLHERNIAHLDIKPQNLVMMGNFPDCKVKLCDFEISRVILEGTEVREILGTPDYVAPEILHYDPITLAADMWSLGVTTYVLLTGFSPFGGETDQETFKNIILGKVDFPEELFEDVSVQARDFVAKLLVLEPSARMTAKQCLRHDWLHSAPTQASAHLRKYLSKSREVLLERVVSRENLRRAALLNNAGQDWQQQQSTVQRDLSQSEICLSGRSGSVGDESGRSSRNSLASSSMCSSRSSLGTSQSCLLNKEQTQGLLNQAQDRSSLRASLAHGLNKVSLLSKIRNLSSTQSRSQACLPLLNSLAYEHGSGMGNGGHGNGDYNPLMNQCRFDGSREKLYGLKSLSKSQGMLDIYRSLESLQKHKQRDLLRQRERSKTEDVLPLGRPKARPHHHHHHLDHGSSSASLNSDISCSTARYSDYTMASHGSEPQLHCEESSKKEDAIVSKESTPMRPSQEAGDHDEPIETLLENENCSQNNDHGQEIQSPMGPTIPDSEMTEHREIALPSSTAPSETPPINTSEYNLDSLQSIESDTLTDSSSEISLPHDITSHSCNDIKPGSSANSSCGSSNWGQNNDFHPHHSDSEIDEPNYTVAQLVSAFNKHQEVTTRASLESLVAERRVADDSSNFPIGAMALRLFIPDIAISERKPLIRRKTSYKPRRDWEELRKQSEKNEAKELFHDSGNEEDLPSLPFEIQSPTPTESIEKIGQIEQTLKVEKLKQGEKVEIIENLEQAEQIEKVERTKPVEQIERDGRTKQVEEGKSIEHTNPNEQTKLVKQIEPIENTKQSEQGKRTDQTPQVKQKKLVEQSKPLEPTEPVEQVELIEDIKPDKQTKEVEQIEPIENIRQLEQGKRVDQTKQIDRMKLIEQTKSVEQIKPVKPTDSVEQVKPVEQTEPAEQVEVVEKITPVKQTDVVIGKSVEQIDGKEMKAKTPSSQDSGLSVHSPLTSIQIRNNRTSVSKVTPRVGKTSSVLASKMSVFAAAPDKKQQPRETKGRLAVKERLCTGAYERAMDKFSAKSSIIMLERPCRSRKTSSVQQPSI